MSIEKSVGDLIAGQYEIKEIKNEDALGRGYVAFDKSAQTDRYVKELCFPCDAEKVDAIRSLVSKMRPLTHKSMLSLLDFAVEDERGYIIHEYIVGQPLHEHLEERRQRGQTLGAKAAYSFLAHVCLGLDILHQAGLAYGCLKPEMILVTQQGRIRLVNGICAMIADQYLDDEKRRAYYSGLFIAPEVRESRGTARPCSDVYSIAQLFAELLSSKSLIHFKGSPEAFIAQIPGLSTSLKEILFQSVHADPADRFQSVIDVKDNLKRVIDAPADNDLSSIVVGVSDLRALTVSSDMPALDMTAANASRKPDLFDSAVKPSVPSMRKTHSEVWIFQKDGMDYGPFDHKTLIQKFYDDVIDEATSVLNTSTKKRTALGNIEEFADEVREYLPIRDNNRAVKLKAQQKKQAKIRFAGISAALAILLGIAAVLIVPIIVLFRMGRPEPLELASAMPKFAVTFTVPKAEQVSINMDDSQARALFDPKATAAEREAAFAKWEEEHRKKFAKHHRGGMMKKNEVGDEIEVISFVGENGEELEPLMDWEIEEKCMSPSIMRKQADCFQKYAGGRAIDVTINFTIQTSGIVRGLATNTSGELSKCLISSMSSMSFRPFSGTSRKVSLPVGYH